MKKIGCDHLDGPYRKLLAENAQFHKFYDADQDKIKKLKDECDHHIEKAARFEQALQAIKNAPGGGPAKRIATQALNG